MKIFVSSTYVDLKEYREKVRDAILRLEQEYRGMEYFGSQPEEPKTVSKDKIEQSDILIGVYAHMYGFIPDGDEESITEQEYHYATSLDKPCFCYIIDKNQPWKPEFIDEGENKRKLHDFLKKIDTALVRSRFSTPDNLASQVGVDLGKWISEHKPELKKPVTVPAPPTPYFAHPYPLQKNFTGREKERRELTEWFDNESYPVFAYIAIGGMGKSALAWYWLKEDILGRESKQEGVIWWSFYDKEAGFETFLDYAIEYVSNGETNPKEIASTRNKMGNLYSLLCEKRFLLVLDGFERLLRDYVGMGSPYQGDEVKEDEKKDYKACVDLNCGTFLQMLASVQKTKTLLTSRFYPEELEDLEGCIKKELTKLDKEDALEFFKRQSVKGTRAEIEEVCRAYGFHPLSLRLLSGMIVLDMKYGGDVKTWTKYNPMPKLVPKKHHILELAYNSLDEKKQRFISRVSAFKNPMDYDAISIFNDFGSENKFNEVLIELVDRGMLFRDEKSNKIDLHPIVRRYCYEKLKDKEGVHSKLKDYFKAFPEPKKTESVDDLAPVIELYHHTVGAGGYEAAVVLFRDRLAEHLLGTFGAYQIRIELLRDLFPDSEDKLPRLNDKDDQAWTMNALAVSYGLSGQSRRAMPLLERAIEIWNEQDNKKWLAIGLSNLAANLIRIGKLDDAEDKYRQKIKICREIREESREASGQRSLGLIHSYQGNFDESEKELKRALELFKNLKDVERSKGIVYLYCAFHSLLMSNIDGGLKFAKMARKQAEVKYSEREIIRAEYFLGAAYLMKENFVEAEKHLSEALKRDRKINLVELEPDLLLEFAKLRFKQNHKEEALKHAEEALLIADRCEYRLKQADIHNFLAEFYLAAGELEKAREHGEIAKERAECGYKPALEKAKTLLNEIERG